MNKKEELLLNKKLVNQQRKDLKHKQKTETKIRKQQKKQKEERGIREYNRNSIIAALLYKINIKNEKRKQKELKIKTLRKAKENYQRCLTQFKKAVNNGLKQPGIYGVEIEVLPEVMIDFESVLYSPEIQANYEVSQLSGNTFLVKEHKLDI